MSNYVVLHCHSDMSNGVTNIDSVSKYQDYVKKAQELNMTALAFSEHGSVFDWHGKKKAIEKAGMKYITLTTRHHDGFSLYDTRGLSDYDVMHCPCQRDLIKEFVDACNEEDILPMFYHTTLDWQHELFDTDFDAYLEYLNLSDEEKTEDIIVKTFKNS